VPRVLGILKGRDLSIIQWSGMVGLAALLCQLEAVCQVYFGFLSHLGTVGGAGDTKIPKL
jgi:hypothetical protein